MTRKYYNQVDITQLKLAAKRKSNHLFQASSNQEELNQKQDEKQPNQEEQNPKQNLEKSQNLNPRENQVPRKNHLVVMELYLLEEKKLLKTFSAKEKLLQVK